MFKMLGGTCFFYKYKRKVFQCSLLSQNYSTDEKKLKVLFFGTDNFSLPSIKVLHSSRYKSLINSKVSIVSVVTSFKRPANCVKCYADKHNLHSYKWPIDEDTCKKYDIGIVVSFGHLIPKNLITAIPLGMINVHASILPRWRGAAPIIYSIMKGDATTGVSIMKIEPNRFDIGDIYAQKEVAIGPHVLMPQLHDSLAKHGAGLLNSFLETYPNSLRNPIQQNDKDATYAPKILPTLAEVHWNSLTAQDVYNLYRALFGFRFLRTKFQDLNIKLVELRPGPTFDECRVNPGSIDIIRAEKCIRVSCKDGSSIDVLKLRIEGKRTMSASDFINGFLRKCEKPLVFN